MKWLHHILEQELTFLWPRTLSSDPSRCPIAVLAIGKQYGARVVMNTNHHPPTSDRPTRARCDLVPKKRQYITIYANTGHSHGSAVGTSPSGEATSKEKP